MPQGVAVCRGSRQKTRELSFVYEVTHGSRSVEDPAVKQHTDVEEKSEEWDTVVQ